MSRSAGHLGKFFVVLVCLVSWLEASNHCALASLQRGGVKENCCARENSPDTDKSSHVTCCQSLQSVEQATLATPVFALGLVVAILPDPAVYLPLKTGRDQTAAVRIGDPPAMGGILQWERSHPALAPPFLS